MRLTQYTRMLRTDEVLKPDIALPAVYIIFLLSAFISFRISTREFLIGTSYFPAEPGALAYLISTIAVAFLIISIKAGRKIRIRRSSAVLAVLFLLVVITLRLTFPVSIALILATAFAYIFLLRFISGRLDNTPFLTILAYSLAVFFSFLILAKGIPILDAVSRQNVAVTPLRALFHGFAVFAAVLLITFYEKNRAILAIFFLSFLGILSGFKSDAVAVIVSAAVAGSLARKISLREILLGFGAVALILTLVSNYIAGISYGTWKISPFLYIFYRAGLTFSVFNSIVALSFPYGYLHGGAILSTTQEVVSTSVLGYTIPKIITSTLIGPGMLDFGLVGVAITCILVGLYLGIMDNLRKNKLQTGIYAIALTHSLILIEVGLQLSSVLFYLSLLYLSLSASKQ